MEIKRDLSQLINSLKRRILTYDVRGYERFGRDSSLGEEKDAIEARDYLGVFALRKG